MDGYTKPLALAKYSSDRKLLSKAELNRQGDLLTAVPGNAMTRCRTGL
jgi:hypothetical protein